MVIVDLHTVLNTEPCILVGEVRVRGDVAEDGEDQFVGELENYERNGKVSIRSKRAAVILGARTEAGLGCGRSTDGWMPFPNEAIRDLSEERWGALMVEIHDP